jgi:hypothetical protein
MFWRKKDDVPEISPERMYRFVDTSIDHIRIGPEVAEQMAKEPKSLEELNKLIPVVPGEGEQGAGKHRMFWGVVALVIIAALVALVALVASGALRG